MFEYMDSTWLIYQLGGLKMLGILVIVLCLLAMFINNRKMQAAWWLMWVWFGLIMIHCGLYLYTLITNYIYCFC